MFICSFIGIRYNHQSLRFDDVILLHLPPEEKGLLRLTKVIYIFIVSQVYLIPVTTSIDNTAIVMVYFYMLIRKEDGGQPQLHTKILQIEINLSL